MAMTKRFATLSLFALVLALVLAAGGASAQRSLSFLLFREAEGRGREGEDRESGLNIDDAIRWNFAYFPVSDDEDRESRLEGLRRDDGATLHFRPVIVIRGTEEGTTEDDDEGEAPDDPPGLIQKFLDYFEDEDDEGATEDDDEGLSTRIRTIEKSVYEAITFRLLRDCFDC